MCDFAARLGRWVVALAVTASCAGAAGVAPNRRARDDGPSANAIRAAARRTSERLAKESAEWAVVYGPEGFRVRAKVLSTPAGRRTTFTADAPDYGELGRGQEILAVIERDGLWHVRGVDLVPMKCRPHEYPFRSPGYPQLLILADVRFVDPDEEGDLGDFGGLDGAVATYWVPIEPPARRQAESALKSLAALEAKVGEAPSPAIVEKRAKLVRLLERGVRRRVDTRTGVIVEQGEADAAVRIEGFRFLKEAPPDALSVEETEWLDRSDGPLDGGRDPNDLVMFIHNGTWRPGLDAKEADGRILHVPSGRLWRIPFPGEASTPGCFLPGRKAVAVTGVSTLDGGFGFYRVGLDTGDVRRLGGGTFATGMVGGVALSPDERTLAVVHIPSPAQPSERRVYLLQLAIDIANPLGDPIDVNAISWLPDSSGLIVVRSDFPDDPKKPWVGMVCRLGLDGTVTELFRGANAVVLDRRRMLFRDQALGVWKTCALDGKGPALFGDGLKEYFFPAPSPDGERIVFMRNDPERGPTRYLFNADGSGGGPLTDIPGLWGSPQWR